MRAIETRGLTKTYVVNKKQPGIVGALKGFVRAERTQVQAVKQIDLTIDQGELVGFLGPNGAGKTTTLKMLSGILFPTSGEAKVLGYIPSERHHAMLREIALVMGNKMQLWWDLPAWDSFLVLKELYEVDDAQFKRRSEQLIDALQLSEKLHTQVRKLSLGERMKCELVAALLHAPKVVFLDEPTIGLDVVSQKRIRDFLKVLHREDGCTILLTSHYMQDIQELCKRVIVIDHGVQVFDGTLDALSTQYTSSRSLTLTFIGDTPVEDLSRFGVIKESDSKTAVLEIPRDQAATITAALLQNYEIEDLSIKDVEIEEVIRDLFSRPA
jgi:ABC-2 type transport system ATP-binding protein